MKNWKIKRVCKMQKDKNINYIFEKYIRQVIFCDKKMEDCCCWVKELALIRFQGSGRGLWASTTVLKNSKSSLHQLILGFLCDRHKFLTPSLPPTHIFSTQSILLYSQTHCSFVTHTHMCCPTQINATFILHCTVFD